MLILNAKSSTCEVYKSQISKQEVRLSSTEFPDSLHCQHTQYIEENINIFHVIKLTPQASGTRGSIDNY